MIRTIPYIGPANATRALERNEPYVRCLILPHPSGRCRVWAVLGARERARDLVRNHYPDWSGWRGAHGSAEICRLVAEEGRIEEGLCSP